MPRRTSTKPEWQKKIAKERIRILFEQAKKQFKKRPEYSKRYVELARKIGMRYNVQLPKALKRGFCKKCHAYLVSGVNCTHRTSPKQVALIVTCKECGHVARFPYRREKKTK